MDTQHIERLFGRIMERLDWQEQLLEEISHRQREAQPAEDPAAIKCLNGERLYDNQDLCMMLQVSKRTLQRYRSIGILPLPDAPSEDLLQGVGCGEIPLGAS